MTTERPTWQFNHRYKISKQPDIVQVRPDSILVRGRYYQYCTLNYHVLKLNYFSTINVYELDLLLCRLFSISVGLYLWETWYYEWHEAFKMKQLLLQAAYTLTYYRDLWNSLQEVIRKSPSMGSLKLSVKSSSFLIKTE